MPNKKRERPRMPVGPNAVEIKGTGPRVRPPKRDNSGKPPGEESAPPKSSKSDSNSN